VSDPIEKSELPPEFRVEIRVRNNRIIRARERLGHKSAKAAAAALGLQYGHFCSYEAMTETPLKKDGIEWKESALQIADALFAAPEDLWPEASRKIEKVRATFEATSEQLREFAGNAERRIILEEDKAGVRRALGAIDPRRRRALLQRFEDDAALEEIGKKLDVSRSRAGQIVSDGLSNVREQIKKLDRVPEPPAPTGPPKPLRQASCCVCGGHEQLSSSTIGGVFEYACHEHYGELLLRREKESK
jgi:DNA-directed RNA polymerase specialized sigma24 family protein